MASYDKHTAYYYRYRYRRESSTICTYQSSARPAASPNTSSGFLSWLLLKVYFLFLRIGPYAACAKWNFGSVYILEFRVPNMQLSLENECGAACRCSNLDVQHGCECNEDLALLAPLLAPQWRGSGSLTIARPSPKKCIIHVKAALVTTPLSLITFPYLWSLARGPHLLLQFFLESRSASTVCLNLIVLLFLQYFIYIAVAIWIGGF